MTQIAFLCVALRRMSVVVDFVTQCARCHNAARRAWRARGPDRRNPRLLDPSQAGIGDHPHLSTLVKARRPQHPALSRALRAPEPIPPHEPRPQSLARAVRSLAVRRAALRPRQRAPCPSLCPTSPPRPVAREHSQTDLPRALFAPLPPHAASPLSGGRRDREPPRADARRPLVRFVAGRRRKFGGASEARRQALPPHRPRANACPLAHRRGTRGSADLTRT